MSKFETIIRNDIDFCKELIDRRFANYTHVQTLIGKYIGLPWL